MKMKIFLLWLLLSFSFTIMGESLWDTDFHGYLSGEKRLQEGDIVIVEIDTSLSLSFVSSSKDEKNITFQFSGGEYENLFSFLPAAQTGKETSLRGNENYSFTSTIVTRIIRVEDQRHVYIEGGRSVSFDGKDETLTLSGYIDIRDLDGERKIPFSKIADSRLVFQSFMLPGTDILTASDIEELVSVIEETGLTTTAEAVEVTDEGSVTGDTETISGEMVSPSGMQTGIRKVTLTDEKKKELFLRYINRLIDLIFQ
jgi:hypothetical protein